MKFKESDYISYDPFEGEEGDIALRRVKLVKASKEHPCFEGANPSATPHTIKKGEVYRRETALIDGDYWGKYAICIACMDKWLTEILCQNEEEEDVH